MIGRERLTEMSIGDIDRELDERATTLNAIGESLLPQILAEEMSELRVRRIELEDEAVARMARETGTDPTECRSKLMHHDWNYEKAKR
jgi:hypothetical protein